MRTILPTIFLYITTVVCAKQNKPSSDKQQAQNAALQQQLLSMALSQGLMNSDIRKKLIEQIGKYYIQSRSSSLGNMSVSTTCAQDVVEFIIGFSEGDLWAIKMLDAFGKIPSGITRGTVGSLGDYDTCLGVEKETRFKGKYCLVNFFPSRTKNKKAENVISMFNKIVKPQRHSRKLQPQIAICIPSTCTKEDIQNLLLTVTPTIGLDATVKNCDTMDEEIKVTSSEKLLIFFLSTLFLIVIASTFLDLLKEFTRSEATEKEAQGPDGFLQHFSLLRNARSLFKKENNPDSIRIFHGIRVISTIWLIISHVTIVMYDQAFGGLHTFFNWRKSLLPQVIPSSSMAVETFFFMSAVLLAYNVIKNKDRNITVAMAFQRRYIRTTVPLLFMIGCICLLPYLSSGPLYKEIVGNEAENCKRQGWINLFYVHNFIPYQNMCMTSTWYLAADTQLFLISLFVLIPYRKNPETLVKFIIGVLFLGVFGKIICIVVFNLPPTTLMLDPEFENISYVWQHSYFSPIFHLSTYSIGMLVGCMLASNKKINIPNIFSDILWILSILVQLAIVFGVYVWNSADEPPGLVASLLYGVSHRILWALTLAWITFSCQANDKGMISRFLGAEAFVPLSRLTYMAYLTNFTVKHFYIGTARSLIIYDFWTMMTMVIVVTTMTFFVSLVLTLVFESPFLSIEKAFLKKVLEKKSLKKETEEKK